MLAGFRRLSIGIMWYVDLMVRGIFIQRPILHDVVVAGVGCVFMIAVGTVIMTIAKITHKVTSNKIRSAQ
jgi:hypothetical protein